MNVISLGWGVQSFTLAAMSALGELPPVDAAIHADTTHERSQTYTFAKRWAPWLEERGVRTYTVESYTTPEVWRGESIPAFTSSTMSSTLQHLGGDSTIIRGQAFRTCTDRWKIQPIRRWMQANRNGKPIGLWLGISLDEFQRMKDSDVKYITHRWPLIEKKMTRKDCEAWLKDHDLEVPVKSSCVFCPYHNMAAWRELKSDGNGDWEKAVQVDNAIRKARPPYDLFVHPARKPLTDVDLRTPQEKGQMELWANWDDECSGICGV